LTRAKDEGGGSLQPHHHSFFFEGRTLSINLKQYNNGDRNDNGDGRVLYNQPWRQLMQSFVVMTSSKDVVGSACCAIVVDTMDIKPMVVYLVVRPCLRALLTLQEAQLLGMIPSPRGIGS
jgi:hypothetical protein